MSGAQPRVLVSRPRPEADRTAHMLAALGCEAVLAPVLAIVPMDAPAALAAMPDALVATSAHAFLTALPPGWTDLPVFAVGEATAAAARAAGCRRVRSAGGDAVSLAGLLVRATAPDAQLLLLAGRPRKPLLEQASRDAGRTLRVWERYEARALAWTAPLVAELQRAPTVAAVHFSPRSAALAAAAAEAAGLGEAWRSMHHVCLSAEVAAALPAPLRRPPAVAMRPTAESLLQALAGILLAP